MQVKHNTTSTKREEETVVSRPFLNAHPSSVKYAHVFVRLLCVNYQLESGKNDNERRSSFCARL